MALNTMADLSTIVANNVDVIGQPTLGSADANQLDAVDRSTLALLARFYGDIGGVGTVGGSANAVTLTSLSTYQALEDGLVISFKASAANTAAATLNLDGLGAKAIRRKGDTALSAGDIAANGRYDLVYDAAYNAAAGAWVLKNPEAQAPDADLTDIASNGLSAFSGLLYGLTLSNNSTDATNDIDIAAGIAIDATNAKFMKLASGLTKRLDSGWAVGTNQGGLDTGSIANTTYHVWLIMRTDTGVVDVLLSASASSPTMPSNYDYKRRIGSIVRSGGAILAFIQNGDRFDLSVPISNVNQSSAGTSPVTATASVPTGVVVEARLTFGLYISNTSSNADAFGLITSLAQADTAPSSTLCQVSATSDDDGDTGTTVLTVVTDTSAQFRYRVSSSFSDLTVTIATLGWVDNRGRT